MFNSARLEDILARYSHIRIAVLGDLMVDRFIYGDAERLSPEAPVPVVRLRYRTSQPGGAANVASNVASLGGEVSVFGAVGADEAGAEIKSLLESQGADLRGIVVPFRLSDHNQDAGDRPGPADAAHR